jgi:phage FluMu protein Com
MNNNIFPTKTLFIQDNNSCAFNCCECPKCKTINWIYLGRMNDETTYDRNGFECFNCSWQFYFDKEDKFYCESMSVDEQEAWENAIFEEGKKEIPETIKEFLKNT